MVNFPLGYLIEIFLSLMPTIMLMLYELNSDIVEIMRNTFDLI